MIDREEKLVLDVQSGRLDAFEELIHQHSSRLRAFIAMRMPVPHLIDEIAHETFVFAYRRIHDFEPGTDFGKWLRSIAFNLIRKEQQRYQRLVKNQERYQEYCLVESACRGGPGPESAVISHLEECVDRLPEGQRDLLRMKYRGALPTREIAEALGQSEAWVRTTLYRVRAALRDCVEGKEATEPAG